MAATATTDPEASPRVRDESRPLVIAAMASLGAGAIHAAAVGVHSEHQAAALAFTTVAVAQLAWGAAALTRGGRGIGALGAIIQAGAVAGWLAAKTTGISIVDGLDVAEPVQLADGVAAGLAGLALVLSLHRLVDATFGLPAGDAAPAMRGRWAQGALAVVVAAVSVTAMVSAGSHAHPGGHDAGGTPAAEGHDHAAATGAATAAAAVDGHGGHGTTAAAPVPYDPDLPIDLGGVEGVTPQQQAAAENLVAITLARLPQFADPEAAEAQGYSSIGDGITGHEHLIKWDTLDDGRILDPDAPESLVYDTSGGGRRLVSAMYMLQPGATLDEVPELGGKLTQWHIHDNLCFTPGDNPRVAGITSSGGPCPGTLQKLTPVPMIHVWIEPNRCGPFSALEGVGAGQVAEGEEHRCDHAHGS